MTSTPTVWSPVSGEELVKTQLKVESARKQLKELENKVKEREEAIDRAKDAIDAQERMKERELLPVISALDDLTREEAILQSELKKGDVAPEVKEFLKKHEHLKREEDRLLEELRKKEDELTASRRALCHCDIDTSTLSEEAKLQLELYTEWKRVLAEREEVLRTARREKYRLMSDVKSVTETQAILADVKREGRVRALRQQSREWSSEITKSETEVAALEASLAQAKEAMRRFRREFEQLRVALLIDRMAKSSKMAALKDRKRRLETAEKVFQSLVEKERIRAEEGEAKKWEAQLQREREAAAQELEQDKQEVEKKIELVKEALEKRYREGFEPLLRTAEQNYENEVKRAAELEAAIVKAEKDIDAESRRAREEQEEASEKTTKEEEQSEEYAKAQLEMRKSISKLWDTLDVETEEIIGFLSEVDMCSPYDEHVHKLYKDMEQHLLAQTERNECI